MTCDELFILIRESIDSTKIWKPIFKLRMLTCTYVRTYVRYGTIRAKWKKALRLFLSGTVFLLYGISSLGLVFIQSICNEDFIQIKEEHIIYWTWNIIKRSIFCMSRNTIGLKYMERYLQPEVWSRDFWLEPSLSPR